MLNIKYNKSESEFEFQAYFYNLLKSIGYNVRGEIVCYYNKSKYIFDLVVYDDNNVQICVIETKKSNKNHSVETKKHLYEMWLKTDQGRRYFNLFNKSKIKFFYVRDYFDIEVVLKYLSEIKKG